MYQPPPTQYPPQAYRPPQPPRRRVPRVVWIIVAGIVGIIVIAAAISEIVAPVQDNPAVTPTVAVQATAPSAPTRAPATATPATSTIKTFSGHSSGGSWYDTPAFVVPNNWQVAWTCTSGDTSLPIVTIAGYDHSGNPLHGDDSVAAHGQCSSLAGIGPVQKQGGTIHLHIYIQGDWTVTVRRAG